MTHEVFVVTQIILLILIPIINFISKKYFGKYFEKKGENLATKEDIKELTRLTEETKKEFTDKADELRAQLVLSNQHTLNLWTAEREALIKYSNQITTWVLFLYRQDVFSLEPKDRIDIKEVQSKTNKFRFQTLQSEAHLQLFIEDKALQQLRNKLYILLISYENYIVYMDEFTEVYYQQYNHSVFSDSSSYNVQQELNNYISKQEGLRLEYEDKLTDKYNAVYNRHENLIKRIRELLYKDI